MGGVAPTGVVSATGDFSVELSAANFGSDGAGSARYTLVLPRRHRLWTVCAGSDRHPETATARPGRRDLLNEVGTDIIGQSAVWPTLRSRSTAATW